MAAAAHAVQFDYAPTPPLKAWYTSRPGGPSRWKGAPEWESTIHPGVLAKDSAISSRSHPKNGEEG